MRGETKSRAAMSLLAEPFADQSDDVALGGGERCPAAGGSFAFAAAALGVGDRLVGGQGRALGPRGVKVLLAHGVSKRRHRGFVAGVPDLEPHRAHALPNAVCRAEEPRGFAVTAGVAGQSGEALQDVGNAQVRLRRSAAIASASWASRSACSGSPCAIATRARVVSATHQPPARRRRDGVVGPAAGREQIPARQRGLRTEDALRRRHRGQATHVLPGRLGSRLAAVATSPAARAAVANAA